ncbi:MAG: NYN domain-containing protein [Candidatus Parcubacteria bacterium]|nr:NYN domain-containing protein [Candidatus Parcubacteria bacterium]
MEITRIAIVVDGPNFYYTTQQLGMNVNFRELLYMVSGENIELPICKIFYDEVPGQKNINMFLKAMAEIGFELVPVPLHKFGNIVRSNGRNYKSSTDQMITVHLMEHLLNDEFDNLIFFTGDSDYRFLLQRIKQAKKKIHIFSASENISSSLLDIADQVVMLNKLKKDSKLLMPKKKIFDDQAFLASLQT